LAITYVNGGTEGFPSFGTNPGAPASLAANDVCVLFFYSPDNATHTVNNSFTKKLDYMPSATEHISVWYKRLAGTSMGTTVCTLGTGGNDGAISFVAAFRGCITTGDPFDVVSSSATTTGSVGSIAISAITTTQNGDMLIAYAWDQNPSNTFSSVTGYTTSKEYGNGNGTQSDVIAAYLAQTTAGSTGTATANITGTSSVKIGGILLSLQPPAAGGTTQSLSGTIAGAAALSGSTTSTIPMSSGTVAGVSTLSGDPFQTVQESGTVAGVSALSGSPVKTVPETGTIAGVSALSGSTRSTIPLTGTIAGVSTLSGSPGAQTLQLTGTIAGASTLSGAPARTAALTGTLAGSAALSGSPTQSVSMSGTAAGVSTLAGSPAQIVRMLGTVAGGSVLSGSPGFLVFLSGSLSGVSALSGDFTAAPPTYTLPLPVMAGIGASRAKIASTATRVILSSTATKVKPQ
jgi:fibronectin-binding autotransporter adhesin